MTVTTMMMIMIMMKKQQQHQQQQYQPQQSVMSLLLFVVVIIVVVGVMGVGGIVNVDAFTVGCATVIRGATTTSQSSSCLFSVTSSSIASSTTTATSSSTNTNTNTNTNTTTTTNSAHPRKSAKPTTTTATTTTTTSSTRTAQSLERQIVTLGRQGKTDQALQLYYDCCRRTTSTTTTVRIWNAALDACARAQPTRLELAFDLFAEQLQPSLSPPQQLQQQQQQHRPPHLLLLKPNVFTFGALMNACNRAGDADRAVQLLHDMQQIYHVQPNAVVYSSAIAACARAISLLDHTKNHHHHDNNNNNNNNNHHNNNIKKANQFKDMALKLLRQAVETPSSSSSSSASSSSASASATSQQKHPKQQKQYQSMMSVVGFNAAISACAQAGDYINAIRILQRMQQAQSNHHPNNNNKTNTSTTLYHVPPPDSVTYGTVLAACEKAQQWHVLLEQAQQMQTPTSTTTSTTTIVSSASLTTTDTTPSTTAMSTTVQLDGLAIMSCLHACAQLGKASEALYYLQLLKDLQQQKQQQQQQQQRNNYKNTNDNYNKNNNGTTDTVQMGRPPLLGPDAVAYHVAISACARGGAWQDGIRLLEECRRCHSSSFTTTTSSSSSSATTTAAAAAANVVAYTAAITGCEYAGQWKHALALLDQMRRQDRVQPNQLTMCAVLGACAKACAMEYNNNNNKHQHHNNNQYNNINIINGDQYNDDNDDDGTWYTPLFSQQQQQNQQAPAPPLPYIKGMQLLQILKRDPTVCKPNIQIYNAAIRLCAEARQVETAFTLLDEIIHVAKLERTQVTYGSLMTACERVGDMNCVTRAFRLLKQEKSDHLTANEIIYGAAISCCRKAKEPQRARGLLQKMISEGLTPNVACFNTVLMAQTDAKRVKDKDTILQIFQWMKMKPSSQSRRRSHSDIDKEDNNDNDHNELMEARPNRQTYNILIQYFAATNQPATAETFLDKMRIEGGYRKPDVDLFTATVAAYERTQQPFKALNLMQRMEEYGYDFYSVQVLNTAFKKAVKLANALGQNLASVTGKQQQQHHHHHDDKNDDDDEYDNDRYFQHRNSQL
jgi:pentatricopeptide repeat domain-containing protein 1